MALPFDNRVLAVISGDDHDLLMSRISDYELLASYGHMDPDVEKWLTVAILMPRQHFEIVCRSLREDCNFDVVFCNAIEDVEEIVRSRPDWQ